MQKPLAGRVLLNGQEVHTLSLSQLARQLSIVLTERVATGMLTAYELVAMGRHPYTDWRGNLTAADHEVVRRSIQAVRAEDLIYRNVMELSDGERQKLMVARALAQQPSVMILDEITAFLDLPRRVEVVRLLSGIAHRDGCAILLSTHDLELAMRNADRIWLYPKGGPLQEGLPEELAWTGALDEAFRSEGLRFDGMSGSFQLTGDYLDQVTVTGDGLHAMWTGRALQRKGLQLVQDRTCPFHVEVRLNAGRPEWISNRHGIAQEHDSLEGLLAAASRRSA
jgi:iron complex transport system ATP-binding protein